MAQLKPSIFVEVSQEALGACQEAFCVTVANLHLLAHGQPSLGGEDTDAH